MGPEAREELATGVGVATRCAFTCGYKLTGSATERMPSDDLRALIRGLLDQSIAPDFVDWDNVHEDDRREMASLLRWEIGRRSEMRERARTRPAQRRAYGLLRSFLTPSQNEMLTTCRYFYVTGSAGGIYRLRPRTGRISQVEQHGSRFFRITDYCFHDPDYGMPPADLTIAHMMWVLSDEPAFLAEANASDVRSTTLWNGEWLSRLARRRKMERELKDILSGVTEEAA